MNKKADIAHLVEHLTCNEVVEGSSPSVGSIKTCLLCNGSELGYIRGKRGRIEIVLCPECLGNGYVVR